LPFFCKNVSLKLLLLSPFVAKNGKYGGKEMPHDAGMVKTPIT
jgi:hypothetical protein